jgi:hypothetical protein
MQNGEGAEGRVRVGEGRKKARMEGWKGPKKGRKEVCRQDTHTDLGLGECA